MDKVTGGGMLSFDTVNMNAVESLFHSEGFYWLSTAVATGVAAEEIGRFCGEAEIGIHTEDTIALFNQCIRNNSITRDELEQARAMSMDNLRQIDAWNRQTLVFKEQSSLGISKGFTSYWLNFKLIELEWQQVLESEEMDETYQFLNQVLADSAELDAIEEACSDGTINEDQRLFLRSHWQRSQLFWTNLHSSLRLLSLGLIELRQPQLTQ
ncbi:MAG: hypothetical protein IIV00_01655 [Peptococcaceae bacterium]|nr:hypothetical protein [Peptococcaceae bacterium]